jgi:Tfp pilus assembly protein PilX
MPLMIRNEKGTALVIALMFLVIILLLGTTSIMVTSTDMKISSNRTSSEQAFYSAEAGVHEALYRLGLFDDNSAAPLTGSYIAVNNIDSNNACISTDPNGLLTNSTDDDGNGVIDDIGDLNYSGTYDNRTWKAKIMLSTSAPAGLVDNTTFYTNTTQPSDSWIEYSSAIQDGTELTIEFRRDTQDMDGDSNTDEIVFYNSSLSSPYNVETSTDHASGQPVLVITSTGKAKGSRRKLVVEAVHQPVNIARKAPLVVNTAPLIDGFARISGFNHDPSTSFADAPNNPGQWIAVDQFKTNGIDNHGGPEIFDYNSGASTYDGNDDNYTLLTDTAAAPNNEEELETEASIPYGNRLVSSGHLPGICAATGTVTTAGKAHIFGGDATTPWKAEGCAGYSSLADALGVSQATLGGILAKANVKESDMDLAGKLTKPPRGVIYINNAGGTELAINSSTPGNEDGWGLMYITGNANFQQLHFKGMIYIEGNVLVGGGFWLLGCVVVKGATTASGGTEDTVFKGTFLYSDAILESYVNKGMRFPILSWKEEAMG